MKKHSEGARTKQEYWQQPRYGWEVVNNRSLYRVVHRRKLSQDRGFLRATCYSPDRHRFIVVRTLQPFRRPISYRGSQFQYFTSPRLRPYGHYLAGIGRPFELSKKRYKVASLDVECGKGNKSAQAKTKGNSINIVNYSLTSRD